MKFENDIDGTFMTQLQPIELEQQPYIEAFNGVPSDVIALLEMNAFQNAQEVFVRLLSIDNPAAREKILAAYELKW